MSNNKIEWQVPGCTTVHVIPEEARIKVTTDLGVVIVHILGEKIFFSGTTELPAEQINLLIDSDGIMSLP